MKNNDFDLEEMRRLWQEQTRALEGRSLISEETVRLAMQSTRKAEVRPLGMWRRVAAVAVVMVLAGVTLWQWPFGLASEGSAPTASVKIEPLSPEVQKTIDEHLAAEPAPVAEPMGAVRAGRRPPSVAQTSPQEPQKEAAAEVLQPITAELPTPADLPDKALLAQADVPRQTAWPNRNRRVDTIVVETSRLVHFDAPKRKSIAETLFEPLLASL